MSPVLSKLAETNNEVLVRGGWNPVAAKAFMLAFAFAAAAIGLGWVGSAYMNAIGRNPEAGKASGQVIIIAAMIEFTALLGFLTVIILK